MGLLSFLGDLGAAAAAPFTGGASLAAIPAIGAIGGALGNTSGARTGTTGGTSNQTTTQTTSGTTTPTIAPGYQSLSDLLNARATANLQNTDLSGYTTGGIGNINNTYKNIALGNNANLTARGLANSPVAAAVAAKTNLARGGDIASFQNSVPLLQQQLTNQGIGSALNVISGLGKGTSTTGTSNGTTSGTQTGTYTNPGSALASGFSSAAELLAYLQGKGALTGGTGGNPFGIDPSTVPDIGAIYSGLGG